jgi:HD-GYP domain-containing protein (c-di-GMP phosphodiesterase class II)
MQDAAGRDVATGSRAPSDAGSDDPVRAAMRSQSVQATALSDSHAGALGVDALVRDAGARHATAIPLANRKGQDLGAILLLHGAPMDDAHLAYVDALSNASVSSLETRELIASQKRLFQSFIELIAGAIDAKSPYTGGHCARVPELTKMLARAACDQTSGPFAEFRLDDEGWEAVHVAAWLHDCGKVTTPEYVVDKATKLETLYDRIHEIRMRFEVLKRDARIACLEARLAGAVQDEAEERLQRELRQLDDDFAFIAACNEGGEFMAPERVERLKAIADRTWMRTLDDRIGLSHEERTRKDKVEPVSLPARERLLADKPEHRFERPAADALANDNPWGFRMRVPELLYDKGELHNLSVGRGTLSEEERYKINEHIVQTIKMLSRLPFPKHLREVPEIAGGHHEKMDGTGYPRRLSRDEMSPLARMMAIADIFEALTATDRPYKKGKVLSEAIAIMARMTREQHIDSQLFDLFLRAGVYREYAERYLRPEQVDSVDVEAYLDRAG